jgi:hypothetical protein
MALSARDWKVHTHTQKQVSDLSDESYWFLEGERFHIRQYLSNAARATLILPLMVSTDMDVSFRDARSSSESRSSNALGTAGSTSHKLLQFITQGNLFRGANHVYRKHLSTASDATFP